MKPTNIELRDDTLSILDLGKPENFESHCFLSSHSKNGIDFICRSRNLAERAAAAFAAAIAPAPRHSMAVATAVAPPSAKTRQFEKN